jgi:hypothetical protein
MNVYESIAQVASELAQIGIAKSSKNTMQGFNFRGIDAVYNTLAPLLAKHKLCILPRCLERECVERTNAKGTALFYVTVKAEFDIVAADGSIHTVATYGEAMDSGDKATNKAMSAAYKYAAFQTFCIPTEETAIDADATTHEVIPNVAKIDKPQKSVAQDEFDKLPAEDQQMLRDIAMEAIAYIAKNQVGDAVDYIESQDLADLKVPLWSLFDSKQRSAMKNYTLQKKAA